jgi:uncharacterized glyoxalase superfamily protein PhnB
MSKSSSVQPIPEGFHTATPMIMADNVESVITFLQKAFDAQVMSKLESSDGKIMHSQVKIGDSILMFGDTCGKSPAMPVCMYLYVKDANAAYDKAIKAGGESIMEPKDHFYGDHAGAVKDPAGNAWWVATHVEEVAQDELERRARKEEEKMKSAPSKKAA